MKYVIIGVVVVIVSAWLFAFLVSTYRRDYTSLSILTPLVATLIGLLFVVNKRNGNGSK